MKRLGKKKIQHNENGRVFDVTANAFEFDDRIEYSYKFKGMSYTIVKDK